MFIQNYSSQRYYFGNVTTFLTPLLFLALPCYTKHEIFVVIFKVLLCLSSLLHNFSFKKSHPPAINPLCQPSFPISSIFQHCLSIWEEVHINIFKIISLCSFDALHLRGVCLKNLLKMMKWSPFLVFLYLIVCISFLCTIFALQVLCFEI